MPGTPEPLTPAAGERGLSSQPAGDVAELLAPAWAATVEVALQVDLDAPTRLPGWSARTLLVHLGSWDDEQDLERRLAEARGGRVDPSQDADARNARLAAAHHDADRDELVAALRRAWTETAAYLSGPDVGELGTRPVTSVVGELTLTGLVVARAYELAVHTLDLAPAGVEPDVLVLRAGVAALADVTGALAARQQLRATFAVSTPDGGWAVGADAGSWTTVRLDRPPGRSLGWPGIDGSAADVLDAAAGRVPAVQLLVGRRLRVHDMPALLQLLPAVEDVVPGGPGLRAAAGVLSGAGRALGGVAGRLAGLRD